MFYSSGNLDFTLTWWTWSVLLKQSWSTSAECIGSRIFLLGMPEHSVCLTRFHLQCNTFSLVSVRFCPELTRNADLDSPFFSVLWHITVSTLPFFLQYGFPVVVFPFWSLSNPSMIQRSPSAFHMQHVPVILLSTVSYSISIFRSCLISYCSLLNSLHACSANLLSNLYIWRHQLWC